MEFTIDNIRIKHIDYHNLTHKESEILIDIMSDFTGNYHMLGFFYSVSASICALIYPQKLLDMYIDYYDEKALEATNNGFTVVNDWFLLIDDNNVVGRLTLSNYREMIEIALFLCPNYRNKHIVQSLYKPLLFRLKSYYNMTFCFRVRRDNEIMQHVAKKLDAKLVHSDDMDLFVFE